MEALALDRLLKLSRALGSKSQRDIVAASVCTAHEAVKAEVWVACEAELAVLGLVRVYKRVWCAYWH